MRQIGHPVLRLVGAALIGLALGQGAWAMEISGAGATFPYPIYAKWAEAYKAATDSSMDYQAIGSGGGIHEIEAKAVDFGASDMPLKPDDLEKNGLTQFPAIIGGEVMLVNLPGIGKGQVTLDGPTIADIYLGHISKWSDPAIAKLNPGLTLPDTAIVLVYRSDGSGTTFNFTDYLSKVSPEWKEKVGESTAVRWPVTGRGGNGNEGVSVVAAQTVGAIAYVEYAYALENHLAYTKLVNKAGKVLMPSAETFAAAAKNADWKNAQDFDLLLTDQPGDRSWPITASSFILLHKAQDDSAKAKAMLNFFAWAFQNGQAMAADLGYVAVPSDVVAIIEASWKANIKDASGKPVWAGS